MPITLGANIASLRSQRQLLQSSQELGTVFERLSSGQRINRASDDAAGLAIADSLNANARVYNQGVRNLNDGISLYNIADSAIENLSGIIVRLEELTYQTLNGTYSAEQRKALDNEAQALAKEFLRISQTTEFNEQKLFTGDNPYISLQGGIGEDAVLTTSVGGAIGDGTIGHSRILGSTTNPGGISGGDFNNDGNIDLIVDDASSIDIYLGNGDGSFETNTVQETLSNPQDINVGDLNNDGILDFVASDSNADILVSFIGNGDGTFEELEAHSVANDPRRFILSDINGDNVLDYISANQSNNNLSVGLGNGDGTFVNVETITGFNSPRIIVTEDFNGDSIVDLAVTSYDDGEISILLGDGEGSFSNRTDISVGGFTNGLAAEDFNADGIYDLVSVDPLNDRFNVLVGNGDGTFQSALTQSVDNAFARYVSVSDFNGDGISDLFITGGNTIDEIYLGNGDGTFDSGTSFTNSGSNTVDNFVSDFDNDGVYDVAYVSEDTDDLRMRLGNSVAGIAPLTEFSLETIIGAKEASHIFERKREQLTQQRGQIGAIQSRLEVATDVLTVSAENFKAAESRIRDADIAQESANLVRLNILQQAASSVLAQANQQPALALQLLGGI